MELKNMADTQTLDNTIQQVKTFIVENASEFLINILFAFILFYLGKKIAKVIDFCEVPEDESKKPYDEDRKNWLTGLSKTRYIKDA